MKAPSGKAEFIDLFFIDLFFFSLKNVFVKFRTVEGPKNPWVADSWFIETKCSQAWMFLFVRKYFCLLL